MRVLIDYRPALRERTGAGEYVHQLAAALSRQAALKVDVTIFTSSWKDRLSAPARRELGRLEAVDVRIPVRMLNFGWHRLGWPPVELVTRRRFDVVHAAHPLAIPSARAAQVVTIHDLHFLDFPSHTEAEIRRDYPVLVRRHAERADMIIVPSHHTGRLIRQRLGVSHDRIALCRPGAPKWADRVADAREPRDVVFLGTLEPRKNIGVLLDAYARLIEAGGRVPDLVLAGKATPAASGWLDRLARPPLAGHVRHLGYVETSDRLELYRRARLLVLPSLDEGYGLPVLEAMACGVPVVVSTRGSLPEVVGAAGLLVDPADVDGWAGAIQRMLEDEAFSAACAASGRLRARERTWDRAAEALRQAYDAAVAARRAR
jgi:glycosyltransferase involved in cell wall biosynthesis